MSILPERSKKPFVCDSKRGLLDILLRVEGTVQGVGFRPFVYRLARLLRVRGWILNDGHGVLIRACGPSGTLAGLEKALEAEAPPCTRIDRMFRLDPREYPYLIPVSGEFIILKSQNAYGCDTPIPPDLAICVDCLREMRDPSNRRYRHPFINCTNCGPRFSIIEGIPYDRCNTTMRVFELCPSCLEEYQNPGDRRFHAQPVSCPDCGPKLSFWGINGEPIGDGAQALLVARSLIRAGKIVAVKGIGGFHLMCDAQNEGAVQTLRRRKRREEKPFAVMVPDLETARRLCVLSSREEKLLRSSAAPILLAERIPSGSEGVCQGVAAENPLLGLLLPYAPLHHLMFKEGDGPLVATSGNLSDETICIDEKEALERLRGIADGFLIHNRPISRPADDSIVRFMVGGPVVLRRARGYAPMPLLQNADMPPVLAVGAHLKNTISITVGSRIFPSQHVGDLTTAVACSAFSDAIHTLGQIYPTRPRAVLCDLHPDYHSSVWASRQKLPVIRVQHQHAHVLSCMAEHHLAGPVLGVALDGAGYGSDKTIWGGEWLIASDHRNSFQRFAHLRTFLLPGGEAAIHRPAFTCMALLWEIMGDGVFRDRKLLSRLDVSEKEARIVERLLSRKVNAPLTSSMGRLFDGVAVLLGLGSKVAFEAQAAMKLEFAAMSSSDPGFYDFCLREPVCRSGGKEAEPIVVDWEPMLLDILRDLKDSTETSTIARRFHNTVGEMICAMARKASELPVVLTGGCFQNKLLTETAVRLLKENDIDVYWHREVPPNDNGISVGQALTGAVTELPMNPVARRKAPAATPCV